MNDRPIEVLTSTVVERCQDEEYRQGYAQGYQDSVAVMMERCEFLLFRSAALSDLRNFSVNRCADTAKALDDAVSEKGEGRDDGETLTV